MKRVILTYILWAMCPLFINAGSEWSAVADRLRASTVFIESEDGLCSGFVIHSAARKGDKDWILTCAHCNADKLFADHVPATVIYKDAKGNRDLMVLEVDDLQRPALSLASKNPEIGAAVASFGFGFGMQDAMFRQAHISATSYYIPEGGIGGPFLMIDAGFVGGQSGGAVVNQAGEVVMIVQRGSESVGIGIGAELIRESVGRYFGKP